MVLKMCVLVRIQMIEMSYMSIRCYVRVKVVRYFGGVEVDVKADDAFGVEHHGDTYISLQCREVSNRMLTVTRIEVVSTVILVSLRLQIARERNY